MVYSPVSLSPKGSSEPSRRQRGLGSSPLIAFRLQHVHKPGIATLDDPPIDENVHDVRPNVVQDPLVMGDHEQTHVELIPQRVDPLRDDPQRVDVQSVSSSTAYLGRSNAICRISARFFSPPEKPSFR